jgi:hypothetical protein
MRQAIHILKKDVRHLWIEIAIVLAATGLFAFAHTHPEFWQTKAQVPQTVTAFFVSFLLPVAWWVLIVRAIHGETLAGDQEFWPTRPYSWKSLLGAKLLFMVLFVNLPTFVAQVLILQAHGFHIGSEIGSLLWNQMLLTAALFLPVAAVGALTTGIVQFLLIGLVVFAMLLLLSLRLSLFASALAGGAWGPLEWINSSYTTSVVALSAAGILIWQYRQRRTLAARLMAAAVVVVVTLGAPLSWTQAFAIQSRFGRAAVGAGIAAGYARNLQWMTRALVHRGQSVSLNIPLQFTGVPDDLVVKPEGVAFTIEAPGGAIWHAERRNITATGQLISLRSTMDEGFYRKVKDEAVTVRGEVYLTLYGNRRETKVPVTGEVRTVPGMGLCKATGGPPATYFLSCFSTMRPRANRVAVMFEPHPLVVVDHMFRGIPSYSPFPAEMSIDPLTASDAYSTYQGPLDAVTVSSEEPVAFVRAPLTIEGLRLGAYEAVVK